MKDTARRRRRGGDARAEKLDQKVNVSCTMSAGTVAQDRGMEALNARHQGCRRPKQSMEAVCTDASKKHRPREEAWSRCYESIESFSLSR